MHKLSPLDIIRSLYNGYGAIAERTFDSNEYRLHIVTDLDAAIRRWVADNISIILTGNPGDGKTHLFTMLEQDGVLGNYYLERDASQRNAEDLLEKIAIQQQKKMPFLLAINHAPLLHLAEVAKKSNNIQLSELSVLPDIVDSMVVYNEPISVELSGIVVVNLSERELITQGNVRELANQLSNLAKTAPCTTCPPRRCPIDYNAEALGQEDVQDNIFALLELVTRRGVHITMRDLVGLFAYLIVGDVTCEQRWAQVIDEDGASREARPDDYMYYNLLFKGRSRLFDAIRATFDPGQTSDPQTDVQLWAHQIPNGWLMTAPVSQPATLSELRVLKRRYFFEHTHDTQALLARMLSETPKEFDALMTGRDDERTSVEHLIALINLFYAPLPGSSALRREYPYRLWLWNSHRYAVGNVAGYVAMRSLSVDKFALYRPSIHPKLKGAMQVRHDHVLLGVNEWQPGDPALRVDWQLYQALAAAQSGQPISLQPYHILRRLDLFLRRLGSEAGVAREIETVLISDHNHRSVERVLVNRVSRRYELEGRS